MVSLQQGTPEQEAGFDHHMVKPVDPRALVKHLAEVNVIKERANKSA
jgi:hypothetical protein